MKVNSLLFITSKPLTEKQTMSNYPDDMNQHNDNPNSPAFNGDWIEAAHIVEIKEIEGSSALMAEIISELPVEKYNALTISVINSLDKIGRFMADALHDSDPEAFQELLVDRRADLPSDAQEIIDDAISSRAMDEVLRD